MTSDTSQPLRADFRGLLTNERTVVFDLRPEVGSLVAGE